MVNFLLMLLILPFDILLKVYCLGKKYLKTPDIEIDCGSTQFFIMVAKLSMFYVFRGPG